MKKRDFQRKLELAKETITYLHQQSTDGANGNGMMSLLTTSTIGTTVITTTTTIF